MTRIAVNHLWKEYDDQVVLENVNLQVDDHEFVTIVGASGCGKTTFLKMLLGIESPSRGTFLIDGEPLPSEPGPDRGIVFQRYSLFPHLTVLKNLMLGLELRESRFSAGSSGRRGAVRSNGLVRCWRRWVCRRLPTSIRRSCRVVCSSACRSRNR